MRSVVIRNGVICDMSARDACDKANQLTNLKNNYYVYIYKIGPKVKV